MMSVSPTLQNSPSDSLPSAEVWYPPRPDAEKRFYSVTVGLKPGVYAGAEDWSSQVTNVPGAAVLSFDSATEAVEAYKQALTQELVVQVQMIGERRILTYEDTSETPGFTLSGTQSEGKWYALTVGTEPGLYPAKQNITPLTSNVSGARCKKWGTYELAHEDFCKELTKGSVVKDTTKIIRTTLHPY